MEVRRELTPSVEAVSEARLSLEELRSSVRAQMLETAQILVNELVTNSVRHTRLTPQDRITLKVTISSGMLRAEVCDPDLGFEATPREKPGPYQTSGWGLYIVEQLAERWGMERDTQKCVWFELGPSHPVEVEGHAAGSRRRNSRREFSARVREEQGIPVVVVRGDVDLATFPRLQAAIEEALARAEASRAIVLDLSEVGFFDSTGIGLLVGSTKKLRERGGEVHLVTREGPC